MTTEKIHLVHMICDSRKLEQTEEPGQAFDKLARGIEARLHAYDGQSQGEKINHFFRSGASHDEIWQVLKSEAPKVGAFAENLSYYVRPQLVREARLLCDHGEALVIFTQNEDRENSSRKLAAIFQILRNKRFHGEPAFSGCNIRVSVASGGLLNILRSYLQRELNTLQPNSGCS